MVYKRPGEMNKDMIIHIIYTLTFASFHVIGKHITSIAFAFKRSWLVNAYLATTTIVSSTFVDIYGNEMVGC